MRHTESQMQRLPELLPSALNAAQRRLYVATPVKISFLKGRNNKIHSDSDVEMMSKSRRFRAEDQIVDGAKDSSGR